MPSGLGELTIRLIQRSLKWPRVDLEASHAAKAVEVVTGYRLKN
jgi:hypothetical protein